jgi:hypothetical protein
MTVAVLLMHSISKMNLNGIYNVQIKLIMIYTVYICFDWNELCKCKTLLGDTALAIVFVLLLT